MGELLVPGYEAPVYVAWSRRNGSALVRVPLYHPGKEKATRMELRCPGPGVQPVPDLRGLAARGFEGSRRATTGADWGSSSAWRPAATPIEITAESELVLRTLREHTFNRFVEIKRQE